MITFLAIMLFAAGILGFVFVGEVSSQNSIDRLSCCAGAQLFKTDVVISECYIQ